MGQQQQQFICLEKISDTLYGHIELCQSTRTGQRFAIKCFDIDSAMRKRALNRNVKVNDDLRNELRFMTLLGKNKNQKHIVQSSGMYQDKGTLCLIMEYCPNGDLWSYIQRHGPLPMREIALKFHQVVSAVSQIHALGFAHRDLSLENVLLDKNERCKICDFGLVKPIDEKEQVSGIGKLRYMAPEVVSGSREGYSVAETDIWSLGILLFVLINGTFPFAQADDSSREFRIFSQHGIQALIKRNVPKDAVDLLDALLQVDPIQRIPLKTTFKHPFLRRNRSFLAKLFK